MSSLRYTHPLLNSRRRVSLLLHSFGVKFQWVEILGLWDNFGRINIIEFSLFGSLFSDGVYGTWNNEHICFTISRVFYGFFLCILNFSI